MGLGRIVLATSFLFSLLTSQLAFADDDAVTAALKSALKDHDFHYLGALTTEGRPGSIYVKVEGDKYPDFLCDLYVGNSSDLVNSGTFQKNSEVWADLNSTKTSSGGFLASLSKVFSIFSSASAGVNWNNTTTTNLQWGPIGTLKVSLLDVAQVKNGPPQDATIKGKFNVACYNAAKSFQTSGGDVFLADAYAIPTSLTASVETNPPAAAGAGGAAAGNAPHANGGAAANPPAAGNKPSGTGTGTAAAGSQAGSSDNAIVTQLINAGVAVATGSKSGGSAATGTQAGGAKPAGSKPAGGQPGGSSSGCPASQAGMCVNLGVGIESVFDLSFTVSGKVVAESKITSDKPMNVGVHFWKVSDLVDHQLFAANVPDRMTFKAAPTSSAELLSPTGRVRKADFHSKRLGLSH
jgi:hypothetical protein